MNQVTIVVLLLLIFMVVMMIRGLIEDKKKGIASCGLDCGACGKCRELKEKLCLLQQSR